MSEEGISYDVLTEKLMSVADIYDGLVVRLGAYSDLRQDVDTLFDIIASGKRVSRVTSDINARNISEYIRLDLEVRDVALDVIRLYGLIVENFPHAPLTNSVKLKKLIDQCERQSKESSDRSHKAFLNFCRLSFGILPYIER